MPERTYSIDEINGFSSAEGYRVYPPCCPDIDYTIALGTLIKSGECFNCGTEIDIKLTVKE